MADTHKSSLARFSAAFWRYYEVLGRGLSALRVPELLLTTICCIVGLFHFSSSEFRADWILVALIILATLPWLSRWMRQTFKSIGSNSELREIEQGSAPGPALQKNAGPQQTQLNLKFADL